MVGSARQILLVDDDTEMLDVLEAAVGGGGVEVRRATSVVQALELIDQEPPDVVISDLMFPENETGMDLLRETTERHPNVRLVLVTGHGSVETAVESLKLGAFDYILKPFDPDDLMRVVSRLFAFCDLEAENERLRTDLAARDNDSLLVTGASEAMRRLMSMLRAVAPMPTSVLIRGESGTGKELIADEVHRLSPRADKAMVKVNCAALPETLLEDELFGHEKGAFTHASARRIGRFEEAHGGTIFLDEIGEMSPLLQAKLLRVLQERSFQRVGSNETIEVDVRVICATNRDLETAVAEGTFREDLYYRINVVQIRVPPLRDRREDIPVLIETLARRRCLRLGLAPKSFRRDAMAKLQEMDFPGNIRELQNLLERVLVFCNRAVVTAADIPDGEDWVPPDFADLPAGELPASESTEAETHHHPPIRIGDATLEQIEREAVRQTLERTGGNMYRAAKRLNISRSTLYSKVRRYGLEGVGKEDPAPQRQGA